MKSIDDRTYFNKINIKLEKLYSDSQNGFFVSVTDGTTTKIIPLDSHHMTYLTYVKKKLHKISKRLNIYQIYLTTLEQLGMEIKEILIESIDSTFINCQLRLSYFRESKKTNVNFFVNISCGDALIIHSITNKPLKCMESVYEQLSDEEWPYEFLMLIK